VFIGYWEIQNVSREIAGSQDVPLSSELFHTSVYKPSHGRLVRQLTALAIWIVVSVGCWRLHSSLRGVTDIPYFDKFVPAILLVAGLWFGFRLVNWPRFADFLIAVEGEMSKVTWPTKDELIRASMVVMFTIAFLAIILFGFDVVWRFIFDFIGITS
jgi:preprotein translocase subunit SecE